MNAKITRVDLAKETIMMDGDIPPEFFSPGMDEAFLGLGSRINSPTLAMYDVEKCLDILVKRDGMTYEEAREFFDFNIAGAWLGEYTPIFVETYWL